MSMARLNLSDWNSLAPVPTGDAESPAVEIRTVFRGVTLKACILSRHDQRRPGGQRRRPRPDLPSARSGGSTLQWPPNSFASLRIPW